MSLFTRDQLTDHVGACRTQSLYKETNSSNLKPLMTLGDLDYDKNGIKLLSLKKLYLETTDPTEYQLSQDIFGSWKFWNRQLNNKLIRAYIDDWRAELEVKLRAGVIKSIYETAMEPGPSRVGASKYIAERGWEKRAGRPSKQEVERTKKIEAGIAAELSEDAERLGMH
jgi:hypothetical protein